MSMPLPAVGDYLWVFDESTMTSVGSEPFVSCVTICRLVTICGHVI